MGQEVELLLKAKNLTDEAFRAVEAHMKSLEKHQKQTQGSFTKGRKAVNDWANANRASFKAVGQALGLVVGAAGAAGAAMIALGKRGAAVGDVRANFEALSKRAEETADVMLGQLRAGVKGTLSDFELMQLANKALGAGLIKSSDDMGLLAEGARSLGKATGIDTKQAFETLTTAIASGRTAQLKQLGLFVDNKKAIEDFAAATGKSVSQLTDADRAQALAAATLEALRGRLELITPQAADFGERVDAMTSRFQNFIDKLALGVSESPVLVAALETIGKVMDQAFGSEQSGSVQAIVEAVERFAKGLVMAGRVGVEVGRFLTNAWHLVEIAFRGLMLVFAKGLEKVNKLIADALELATRLPKIGKAFEGVAGAARQQADMASGAAASLKKDFDDSITSAARTNAAWDASADFLARLEVAMNTAGEAGKEMGETVAAANRAVQDSGAGAAEAARQQAAAEKAAEQAAKARVKAYNAEIARAKQARKEAATMTAMFEENLEVIAAGFRKEEEARKKAAAAAEEQEKKQVAALREMGDQFLQYGQTAEGAFATAAGAAGIFLNVLANLKEGIGANLSNLEKFSVAAGGVMSAFQSGSFLGGAAAGAAAGSAFGPIGAIAGGVIGGIAGIFGGGKKRKEEEARRREEEARKAAEAYKRQMDGLASAMDALNRLSDGFAKRLETIEVATAKDAAQFQRLGLYASATFAKMVRETGDVWGALQKIQPTLDTLASAQERFGFAATATTQKLLDLWTVAGANEGVMDSVSALTQLMNGLGEAGLRNQELFTAFGQDVSSLFDQLTAGGATTDQALALMQPTLQQLWEAQQKFGFQADATTQKLLDQAEAQGVVGEHMKSVNQQILDVLLAIGDALGAKIPNALRGMGNAAEQEFNRATRAAQRFDNNIPRGYPGGGGGVPEFARGGIVLPFRPRAAAAGILAPASPGGELVRMGEGGRAELAAPVEALFRKMQETALRAVAGGGQMIVEDINLDGQKVGEIIFRRLDAGLHNVRQSRVRRYG